MRTMEGKKAAVDRADAAEGHQNPTPQTTQPLTNYHG